VNYIPKLVDTSAVKLSYDLCATYVIVSVFWGFMCRCDTSAHRRAKAGRDLPTHRGAEGQWQPPAAYAGCGVYLFNSW